MNGIDISTNLLLVARRMATGTKWMMCLFSQDIVDLEEMVLY